MKKLLLVIITSFICQASSAVDEILNLFSSKDPMCRHLKTSTDQIDKGGNFNRQSVRIWRSLFEGLSQNDNIKSCMTIPGQTLNIEFRHYIGPKNQIDFKIFVGSLVDNPISIQEVESQKIIKYNQSDMMANQLKADILNHQYIFNIPNSLRSSATIYNLLFESNQKMPVFYCRNSAVWIEKIFETFDRMSINTLVRKKTFEIPILDNPCGRGVDSIEMKILVLRKNGRHEVVTQTIEGVYDRLQSSVRFNFEKPKDFVGKKLLLLVEDLSYTQSKKTRVAYSYLAEKYLSP